MRNSLTVKHSRRRAITIIEAVITAALTALFVMAAFSVISAMAGADTAGSNATAQQATVFKTSLRNDAYNSVPCDVRGLTEKMSLTDSQLVFFSPDGSSHPDKVVWRVDHANDAITRTTYESVAECEWNPVGDTKIALPYMTSADFTQAESGGSINFVGSFDRSGFETDIAFSIRAPS